MYEWDINRNEFVSVILSALCFTIVEYAVHVWNKHYVGLADLYVLWKKWINLTRNYTTNR